MKLRGNNHNICTQQHVSLKYCKIVEQIFAFSQFIFYRTKLFSFHFVFLFSFSQGGEVTRPLDPTLSSTGPLPPPLIPLPKRRASDCEPAEEEEGREAPTLPQDLGTNLGLDVGEPEVAAEAYSEVGGSPMEEEKEEDKEEEKEELSDSELDHKGTTLKEKKLNVQLFSVLFSSRFHLQ